MNCSITFSYFSSYMIQEQCSAISSSDAFTFEQINLTLHLEVVYPLLRRHILDATGLPIRICNQSLTFTHLLLNF